MIDTLLRRYCQALEVAMVACLATMVLLVFGNVVLRYAFNSGISVSEELSRWLFVWLTFLGAIVALREHVHLGTDMLVGRLGPAGRKACLVATHVLMLAMCGLLLRGAWEQTRINLDVSAPSTGAPMAWFYAVGLVFGVSAGLMILNDLWRVLSGRAGEAELVAVRESEDQP